MEREYSLEMLNVSKRFGGIKALTDFSFQCYPGEVHILMGENGAGKSTLLNILGGIHSADEGHIKINGENVEINNTIQAQEHGIAIIHQELSMCKNLTVAENIFRGNEPTYKNTPFVNFDKLYKDSIEIIEHMGLDLDSHTKVGELSIAHQQMVEIVSALSKNADIVVMDEPTASLTDKEVQALFEMIHALKKENKTVIYVSHRMDETFEIGDRVTVMRDGFYIDTRKVSETNADELVTMMVGRSIENTYGTRVFTGTDETVLKVNNFSNARLKNVSFELKKGEILGFSGLVGAGRTELARAIFGLDKLDSGELYLDGEQVNIKHPSIAIKHGIGLVPEDRKGAGLILPQSVAFNLTITVLDKFIHFIRANKKKEWNIVDIYSKLLSIRMSSPEQKARELSGGNQQKVVVSKWLAIEPKILILDEPTRGIDVGAKKEIYDLINRLAKEGISIIFISSDLPEMINIAHRVVVMCEGEVSETLDPREEELTQERIMTCSIRGGATQ